MIPHKIVKLLLANSKHLTQHSKPFIYSVLLNSNSIRGERGIRTPGGVTLNGFQDRRIRPLCHFSDAKLVMF